MRTPDCFNLSQTEAEQHAFELLVDATTSQVNKGAFIGVNPGILNAWHFEIGGVAETDSFYLRETQSLACKAYAQCMFADRAACQKWFMSIFAVLPAREVEYTNIVLLRIAKEGEIRQEIIELRNEKTERVVFVKNIEFDIEFLTGGKGSAI